MTRSNNEKSDAPTTKKSRGAGRFGSSQRWDQIGGILAILLLFFSFYLLISFTSFFISGGADISMLDVPLKDLITDPDLKMQNAGGRWGAGGGGRAVP